MPDYDQPFGLRDNPFSPGPWVGGAKKEWGATDDLWTRPLRIHRVPALDMLFATEAGPFKACIERFDTEMDNKYFSKQEASAPEAILKFLIRGPVGSGKTTFANYLASQLLQYKLPPDKGWETVDYRDVNESESMDSPTRIKAIAGVFRNNVKPANYGGLILDNLDSSDEELVLSTLDQLRRERTIVAFLIPRDNSDFGKSAASKASYTAEFDLGFLDAQQAICFVKTRVQKFRETVKNVPGWMQQPEWDLFPFRKDDIETAVDLGVLGDAPEKKAFPTIRNLGSILKRALEDEREKLRLAGDRGIRSVNPPDIAGRAINLLRYVAQLTSSVTGKRKAA